MNTGKPLIRLPAELARRFRLYQAARAVDQDQHLAAEMAEWDEAAAADGLDAIPPVHEA